LGHEREVDERHLELRALARVHEVAVTQHGRPTTNRHAVHGGDDRLLEADQRVHQARLGAATRAGGIRDEVLQVVAGGERVPRAVPEHDSRLIVSSGAVEQIRHGDVHARRHRVLVGGSIQLDVQNASGVLDNDVTHDLSSSHFAIAPLARRPSIWLALKPSSRRISSLCSPTPGARRAGTFAMPCAWIGLPIVDVRLPPAPSSGTTMSFARSWGSSITCCGPRTGPNVTCTPLNTSYQCAMGCAPNTSSRIAVSCGMF